jgi:small subunit ribosomal protein S18
LLAETPPHASDEDDEDESDEDERGDDEDDEDGDDGSPPEVQGGGGRRRRVEGPAITLLNYKDVGTLSRFLTEQGKILPKRTTKVTAAFQRQLGRAVKRARYLALIPYTRRREG